MTPSMRPRQPNLWVIAAAAESCKPVQVVQPTTIQPPADLGFPRVVCALSWDAGFNKANNIGLRIATMDAVLFLNNDVINTQDGWLEPIRAALRPGRLVGSRLMVEDHTRVNGRLYPYLEGWCLAGMRQDLLDLGGWDETLEEPAYYGDNLLSLRAKRAGLKLVQVDVGLKHLGNYTSKRDTETRERASAANRERFYAEAMQ